MRRLITLLNLSRPIYIILAALTYFLGAAVARYLGHSPALRTFWLGFFGMVLAQMSMSLLAEAFRPLNEPILKNELIAERLVLRDTALYVSIAGLAAMGVIAFLLLRDSQIARPAWFYLGLSLIDIFLYSVPPFRLVDKGYGEVLLSIHLGFLIPSISFLLESFIYHRLLYATLLPLTFLSMAAILIFDFPTYADDLKYGRQNLLVRLGWEQAVPLHHGIVIFAYILLALGPLYGFSLGLLWPAFLTIPFALLQIYWLRNISLGAKPVWPVLTANAIAVFGMTAYFLTLTFWLH
jgi:1,4-dihydroxy-2-naphthoate octaprenyltransferase